ncbi:VOC family protein [Candidatus Binatia bacterium]|jgi:PhnB protein|nr:VOC family protein [Candidatus Binatia bacterium]
MSVHHVPAGHGAVSPYVVTKHVDQVIRLLCEALGGCELHRSTRTDGSVMHAEVRIDDSVVMLGEATDELPALPSMVHVYVPDCDAVYARALALGATSLRAPATQPYGDRSAGVIDAGGNQWWIATHVEDLTSEEIERRLRAV